MNINSFIALLNSDVFRSHITINTFKTYCFAIVAKTAFFVCNLFMVCVALDMGFS